MAGTSKRKSGKGIAKDRLQYEVAKMIRSTDFGFAHIFINNPSNSKGSNSNYSNNDLTNIKKLTLVLLHGTGGNEEDLIFLGKEIDPNASLLSPRGKVLENGMPRFFRRLAEGVFDIEDLKFRTYELADFVEKASKVYGFDLRHVISVGYSNGANIASSLLLLRPEIISSAVL